MNAHRVCASCQIQVNSPSGSFPWTCLPPGHNYLLSLVLEFWKLLLHHRPGKIPCHPLPPLTLFTEEESALGFVHTFTFYHVVPGVPHMGHPQSSPCVFTSSTTFLPKSFDLQRTCSHLYLTEMQDAVASHKPICICLDAMTRTLGVTIKPCPSTFASCTEFLIYLTYKHHLLATGDSASSTHSQCLLWKSTELLPLG